LSSTPLLQISTLLQQVPVGVWVASVQCVPDPHAAHEAPPVPQDEFDSPANASHVPPLQQPLHELPPQLHVPFEQACPDAHALHAAPAVPHCEVDSDAYGTQVVPLQQPAGHEVASQTHWPVLLLHSWPDPHAAQVAPNVPHEDDVSEP
jgi:hypothetical protein